MSPSHENLSPSDWDFLANGVTSFSLCAAENTQNHGPISKLSPSHSYSIRLDILEIGPRFRVFISHILYFLILYFQKFSLSDIIYFHLVTMLLDGKAFLRLTAFTQLCMLNLMWESDYVTQWKFLKKMLVHHSLLHVTLQQYSSVKYSIQQRLLGEWGLGRHPL